ncbi:hypothetical protein BpHYR1_011982 [Brachionus plicatilis]|uniref:Uncharacterized protein n=1 Tax=Brachionus plicatilis TaxID=10195 RepID=A0A3M7RZM6_BRAPC|nr:hypothetical protein BpHYR1_011982 [Brachionus plicatilis]
MGEEISAILFGSLQICRIHFHQNRISKRHNLANHPKLSLCKNSANLQSPTCDFSRFLIWRITQIKSLHKFCKPAKHYLSEKIIEINSADLN